MTENRKVQVALVVACGALALSLYTAVRGGSDGRASGPTVCVDQDARAQMASLRLALAERDAALARLSRAAAAAATATNDSAAATGDRAEPARRAALLETGPRRYVHFEIPNPAVTVTQKDDATYDIRTTDPSLAGSTLQITAVTATGEEDKMMIRIPQ
jgi:hypothetical protein